MKNQIIIGGMKGIRKRKIPGKTQSDEDEEDLQKTCK